MGAFEKEQGLTTPGRNRLTKDEASPFDHLMRLAIGAPGGIVQDDVATATGQQGFEMTGTQRRHEMLIDEEQQHHVVVLAQAGSGQARGIVEIEDVEAQARIRMGRPRELHAQSTIVDALRAGGVAGQKVTKHDAFGTTEIEQVRAFDMREQLIQAAKPPLNRFMTMHA